MLRRALLLWFLLLASGAQAQLADVNETLPDDGLLDGILAPVEQIGEGIGEAGSGIGEGVSGAFQAIGDAIQAIGRAIGSGAEAALGATTAFGGALSGGVATAAAVALRGLGSGAGAVGSGSIDALAFSAVGLADGVAWAAVGVAQGALWLVSGIADGAVWLVVGTGSAIAALAGALWSGVLGTVQLVGLLRPAAMPAPAFWGVAATGATASAAVGGWAGWEALRRWGLVGAGIAGFSRIQDDAVLEHPLRSDIFATIREHPGIHASQIARDVDAGWGTVTHHLDKLTKARLVTTRRVNNQKCYFEQGGEVGRQEMAIASAVKGDTAGMIAQFVAHNPMTSQKQLAEAVGISPALASFHVKKLTNLGVLEKVRRGKETLLSTSEPMRRLMASKQNPLVAVEAPAAAMEFGS